MKRMAAAVLGLGMSGFGAVAWSVTPADQIAQLGGPKYNCMGGEIAGSDSGIPEYSGKWVGAWPGLDKASGYQPGPYADEKPLFTITAANADEHADRLTEGQKALLKRYPDTFKMPVYPSHRDFGIPQWACDVVKKNAAESAIQPNGLGLTGVTGNISFPFPKSGDEAIWNLIGTYRPWNETVTHTIAAVFDDGKITWGKQIFRVRSDYSDPNARGSKQDRINSYFYNESVLPPRQKGEISTGWQPNDYTKDRTQAWMYNPGTRRVRQAPEIGFDYPVPPGGMHTVDDNYVFNGSPERYDWKIVGKKEIYIPIHTFAIDKPGLKYKDILTRGSVNSDYMRYELHRVWVVEGTLKAGVRHIYKKRVIYANEDTWIASWGDNYDNRDQLYRVSMICLRYAPEAQAYHRTVSVYHDLTAAAYEAIYLTNEEPAGNFWQLNRNDLTDDMFGPGAAASSGR